LNAITTSMVRCMLVGQVFRVLVRDERDVQLDM
jgi:hypothetical protein